MEKIIFFALAVPILGFVFYLGGSAIMKGFIFSLDTGNGRQTSWKGDRKYLRRSVYFQFSTFPIGNVCLRRFSALPRKLGKSNTDVLSVPNCDR